MFRAIWVFMAGVLLVPVSAAFPLLGTEENPELSDPAGNVQYSSTYVGAHDHDYVDLLGAWYDYNASTDLIALTVKVVDAAQLLAKAMDWQWECVFQANTTNAARDHFSYTVSKSAQSNSISSIVYWNREDSGQAGTPMRAAFAYRLEKPGYFEWKINRTDYLRHGPGVGQFNAECDELYKPAGLTSATFNLNAASATTSYDMSSLVPTGGPQGSPEPNLNPSDATTTPGSATTEGGHSPALNLVTVGLAMAVVVLARRPRS